MDLPTTTTTTTVLPDTRIIGGDTVLADPSGSHPYPYYVQVRVVSGSSTYFTCGGCIVHAWLKDTAANVPNAGLWILTAAHCLDASADIAINVFVGGVASAQEITQQSRVSASSNAPGWKQYGPGGIRVFSHPLHNQEPNKHAHDIALIRVLLPASDNLPSTLLYTPTSNSGPAAIDWSKLPTMNTNASLRNAAAEVMGFGLTSRDQSTGPSPTLQRADVMIEPSNFQWRQSPMDEPYLTWVIGTKVLTQNETVSTCNGDSGGPLVSGSVVVGPLCCGYCAQPLVSDLRDVPSFYTRVANYLEPPTKVEFTSGLPDGSLFRKGLRAMIEEYSPTPLRSSDIANVEFKAKGDANNITNVWSEGAAQRSVWDWIVVISALLFRYDIVQWILVALAVLVGIYILYRVGKRVRRRKQSGARSGQPGTKSSV